tara:strand:+ start:1771 stop:2175 length:405 start_codon:yes stop_codon:yes gene_type:complete
MDNCIFCKIIKGEIPSAKVYEDDDFLAFLDISPANQGHTLVIPKKHIETYVEGDDETLSRLSLVAKKIAKNINQKLECHGYNILINNHEAAGQEVFHLHMHIIPRFNRDNFKLSWPHKKYVDNGMQVMVEKLKI